MGVACPVDRPLRDARLALHLHQLGGLHGQRGKVVAKGLGNHLLRLVQMVTRIDQVAGRLHRLGATNGLQDGRHRIGMGQDVFAGVQRLTHQQRLGKRAGACQRIHLGRQALRGRGEQLGQRSRTVGLRRETFHPDSFTTSNDRPEPRRQ